MNQVSLSAAYRRPWKVAGLALLLIGGGVFLLTPAVDAAPTAAAARAAGGNVFYIGRGLDIRPAIAKAGPGAAQVGIPWNNGSSQSSTGGSTCSVMSGQPQLICTTTGMGGTGQTCSTNSQGQGPSMSFLCSSQTSNTGGDSIAWCSSLAPTAGNATMCSIADGSTWQNCSAYGHPNGTGDARCSIFGPPGSGTTVTYCSAQGENNHCSASGTGGGQGGQSVSCSAMTGSTSGSFCSVPADSGTGATCTATPGSQTFCSTDSQGGATGACSEMTEYFPPGSGGEDGDEVDGSFPPGGAPSGFHWNPPDPVTGMCGP